MNNIPFNEITIDGGFWKSKQDMIRNVTAQSVYNRFKETHRFEALKCNWMPGDANVPHVFWDSDVAKWIEGVAYLIMHQPDEALKTLAENAIQDIIQNSDENGYFNSHFLVTEQDQRFKVRDRHELYCAGHLMEAAIAWRNATGQNDFLKEMCRYADYIERIFKIEDSAGFATPGHPELELALVKLYYATGEKRYLELSKHFIDLHGCNSKDGELTEWSSIMYNQDEMPLRERSTAEGHSVRALYLLCGMADIASAYQDESLLAACKRVFGNIVNKRMYITGGMGSTRVGEAFTKDYHLPNRTAYAETCAAISLAMFCSRMQAVDPDRCYADTAERAIYNGMLSGISLDGKSFFYENPLEITPEFNNVNPATHTKERYPITQRVEVFGCSCCPPNVLRFIASVAGQMFSEDKDVLYIHHYADCHSQDFTISTLYPANGDVIVKCSEKYNCIALRIPGWCSEFTINSPYQMEKGYAYVEMNEERELRLHMEMPVRIMKSNRKVYDNAGRVAVTRGPVVYCAEGVDNGDDLKTVRIDAKGIFSVGQSQFLLPTITTTGYRPQASETLYSDADEVLEEIPLKLIPYYAFANRGETEMQVWLLRK